MSRRSRRINSTEPKVIWVVVTGVAIFGAVFGLLAMLPQSWLG
jgi:hypothetical protein